MSETVLFSLEQRPDENGILEEFTSDAFLVLERKKTMHLDDNGLPKSGTKVYPGMCLIGRFGTTVHYGKDQMPSELEVLTSEEAELIAQYGKMFYDASLYVPPRVTGIVERSEIVDNGMAKKAIVHVRLSDSVTD